MKLNGFSNKMQSKFIYQLFGLAIFVFASASAARIPFPKTWQKCDKSSPTINKCVEQAAEAAIRDLVRGNQQLGVLPIDPLLITSLEVNQGSGPVSINLRWTDLVIKGIGKAKISNLRVNVDQMAFTARVSFPKLVLEGPYNISGKVLILPINGDGKSHLILDEPVVDIRLTGKRVTKDGVDYMNVNAFDLDLVTKKLSLNFSNLFRGDKLLGDNMNKFLNDNWEDILKEVKPAVLVALSTAFGDITNRVFTKIPYDEIFE